MRALKILVTVMGVLLVGGSIALVAALVTRIEHRPAAPAPAGPVRATLPEGARVVATELAGDRLLVRVALPAGGEDLMLFDARSGARLTVIELRPAAPEARTP